MVTVVAKALFGAVHSHMPGAAVMACTGFGCSHVIVLAETMVAGAECFYSVEVVLVTIDYGT